MSGAPGGGVIVCEVLADSLRLALGAGRWALGAGRWALGKWCAVAS